MTESSKQEGRNSIDSLNEGSNQSYPKDPTSNSKWIDNEGNEVEKVFGFNENAELVNGRAAMFGFLMLIVTEIVFQGQAATHAIFGLG